MATYTFEGFDEYDTGGKNHKLFLGHSNHSHGGSRAHSDDDITTGDVSLAYSASVASSCGESTDSSFDFKVLNLLDEPDDFMMTNNNSNSNSKKSELQRHHRHGSNSSLTGYSTDGESHLEGAILLQTIAG